MAATLHRRPQADGNDVRLVEDGTRFAVFLFAPVALLARGLWGAFALWFVGITILVSAAAAGWLSGWATLLAILVIHLAFAIDIAHLERARLGRRGFLPIALQGTSLDSATTAVAEHGSTPAAALSPPPLPHAAPPLSAPQGRSDDVIGLFPGERP